MKNHILQKKDLNIGERGIAKFLVYQHHDSQIPRRKVKSKDNNIHFGAELILLFEPQKEFGSDGDRITFINVLLEDSFYTIPIPRIKKIYTWHRNEALKKLYQGHSQTKNLQQELNGSYIDQNPDGHDPRYTDINRDELKAINIIKTNKYEEIEEFFGKDENAILSELRCENSKIKHIPYNAFKQNGIWSPARFTDEPNTLSHINSIVGGGQKFELNIIYEPSNGDNMRLGTIIWGWNIDGDGNKARDATVKLLDPVESTDGGMHLQQAISNWNELMDSSNKFPIMS